MKILVGCPTSNHKFYCLKDYVKAVKNLNYKTYDILLVDNSKTNAYLSLIKKDLPVIKGHYLENARDRIIESRNILRKKVLDEDYDYFLSLEQDVLPPRDVIERLLNYNKDIVTGVYFARDPDGNLTPLLYKYTDKENVRNLTFDEVKNPNLIGVDACGLGCVLISRKVLEKIKFRYNKEDNAFDDIWFSIDAKKNGFNIFCDTSVKCKHMIRGRWSWKDIKK